MSSAGLGGFTSGLASGLQAGISLGIQIKKSNAKVESDKAKLDASVKKDNIKNAKYMKSESDELYKLKAEIDKYQVEGDGNVDGTNALIKDYNARLEASNIFWQNTETNDAMKGLYSNLYQGLTPIGSKVSTISHDGKDYVISSDMDGNVEGLGNLESIQNNINDNPDKFKRGDDGQLMYSGKDGDVPIGMGNKNYYHTEDTKPTDMTSGWTQYNKDHPNAQLDKATYKNTIWSPSNEGKDSDMKSSWKQYNLDNPNKKVSMSDYKNNIWSPDSGSKPSDMKSAWLTYNKTNPDAKISMEEFKTTKWNDKANSKPIMKKALDKNTNEQVFVSSSDIANDTENRYVPIETKAKLTAMERGASKYNEDNPEKTLSIADYKNNIWDIKNSNVTVSKNTPTRVNPAGSSYYMKEDGTPFLDKDGKIMFKSMSKEDVDLKKSKAGLETIFKTLDQGYDSAMKNPNAIGSLGSSPFSFIQNNINDYLKIPTKDRLDRSVLTQFNGSLIAEMRSAVESGVMTDADYKRYVSKVPNENDSPKEFHDKYVRLKNMMKFDASKKAKALGSNWENRIYKEFQRKNKQEASEQKYIYSADRTKRKLNPNYKAK